MAFMDYNVFRVDVFLQIRKIISLEVYLIRSVITR